MSRIGEFDKGNSQIAWIADSIIEWTMGVAVSALMRDNGSVETKIL